MLTFAQPLFLFALAGLVLPILIHRISRARPIPWPFPSISRIRQTPLPRHGSRALTDLLLLLLRLLLLAFLITALAGPVWHSNESGSPTTSQGASTTVIVLDYSSSMSGWGAMEETRDILEQIRRNENGRIGWIVYSNSVVAEQLPDSAGAALDFIENFIKDNEPAETAGIPETALSRGLELLGETGIRKLILISDFQTSDWKDTLPYIPDDIGLEVLRVGKENRDRNISLHRVRTLPGERDRIRILSDIMNFGSEEVSVILETTIDGNALSKELTLKPGVRTPAVFETDTPRYPETAWLEVQAGNDPYGRDNKIPFFPSAPPPLNVIALNPTGNLAQGNEEIFFIDQALQIASTQEWIQFSVLPTGPEAINSDTLARIAAVIIPAASTGSRSVDWKELKAFVDGGGLVLVTLGDDAVRSIGDIQSGGFALGDYLGLASRDRFTRHYAGPIPENSPLSMVFDGPAARDLYLMTIRQYSRLAPGEEANVLLQSESGDPLLMSIPSGKGQLIVSTFPWDRSGSDFPLRPSFLPVVREVMGMALDSRRSLIEEDSGPAIPRSESVTTIVPEESLIARLRGGRVSAKGSSVQPESDLAGSAGLQLAPWLLLGAFLFWLSESFLAARLIRQTQSERVTV